MNLKKDVAIIGGGIIGLTCAYYLLEKGFSVTIIEKERIGSGASHGNCGLLYYSDALPLCSPGAVRSEIFRALKGQSPLYIKPELDLNRIKWLCRFALKCTADHKIRAAKGKNELLQYSMALFDSLLSPEFMDGYFTCDFEKKGILAVFKKQENFEKYFQTAEFLEQFDLSPRRISAAELQKLEPALLDTLAGGWLYETDAHLRPDLLMAVFKKYLIEQGLKIMENTSAKRFDIQKKRIRNIETEKEAVAADFFILAAGAWSSRIAEQIKLDLPMQPGKGYSITMENPRTALTFPCMFYEKSMVATPWKTAFRLGGTMEFSGYSMELNKKRLSRLVEGAEAYLKDPVGNPVYEEWTSLRPMMFDDMPVIDASPYHSNLIVATGHGMLGLTLATGTGRLVCDLIMGTAPEIDPAPFSIRRFL